MSEKPQFPEGPVDPADGAGHGSGDLPADGPDGDRDDGAATGVFARRDALVAARRPDTTAPVSVTPDQHVRFGSVDLAEVATELGTAALDPGTGFGPGPDGLDRRQLGAVIAHIDALRSVLAAVEMRAMTAYHRTSVDDDADEGMPADQQGRTAAAEIAIAGHVSPARASRRMHAARRVSTTMPGVFTSLATGHMSEADAYAAGSHAAGLTDATMDHLDAILVGRLPELTGAGDRRWHQEISRIVSVLDPDGRAARHERALRERHVTIRPGADGMGTMSALIPGTDAAAINQMLTEHAETERAAGDVRSLDQIRADHLADTLLGRTATHEPVTYTLNIVMDVDTLLDPEESGDVLIAGHGPHPSGPIRTTILDRVSPHGDLREATGPPAGHGPDARVSAGPGRTSPGTGVPGGTAQGTTGPGGPPDADAAPLTPGQEAVIAAGAVHYRRLFAHPTTGQLVAAESRSRIFPVGLARLIRLRDVLCRGPYCNARIRHIDHIHPHAEGGPTSQADGQGLCAMHNLLKERLANVGTTGTEPGSHLVDWDTLYGTITTTPPPITHPDLRRTA